MACPVLPAGSEVPAQVRTRKGGQDPGLQNRGPPLKVIWIFPRRPGSPGLCWEEQAGSQQVWGDAMPDDHAGAADDTRELRARFPGWGILFDPLERVWVAVRGKRTLVAASSPEKLTEQVEAAARGEAGPDEGDKTKTWRALRKHGRGLAAAAGRNGAAPGGFLANGNDASAALTLSNTRAAVRRAHRGQWPGRLRRC